jgi:hypothetical protein
MGGLSEPSRSRRSATSRTSTWRFVLRVTGVAGPLAQLTTHDAAAWVLATAVTESRAARIPVRFR